MSDLQDPHEDHDDEALALKTMTHDHPEHHEEPRTTAETFATLHDDLSSSLRGSLPQPADTNGIYMVLWAKVPDPGVPAEYRYRPDYQEVGFVEASTADIARARALEHEPSDLRPFEERGDVARYLIEQAKAHGILLRAIPAEHWPVEVPVTGFVVPPPILTIG